MLQNKVTQLSTDCGHLLAEVSALQSASVAIQRLLKAVSPLEVRIGQKLKDWFFEQLSTHFTELQKEVFIVKTQIAGY
jgi:hypothetical protein